MTAEQLVEHLEWCEAEHISVVGHEDEWVVVRRSNPTVARATLGEVVTLCAQLRNDGPERNGGQE